MGKAVLRWRGLPGDRLWTPVWRVVMAPDRLYAAAGRWLPWCWGAAGLLGLAGLCIGLLIAPADPEQGDAYRIMFVHVPVAWMSLLVYMTMAAAAALGLLGMTPLGGLLATGLAPTGALMSFLALWSGALWGKPSWGTWWVWDARLSTELLLLCLYLGFLALHAASADTRRADRHGALLLILGAANVPMLYYSVHWWNTLHQDASIHKLGPPAMSSTIVLGVLLMAAACAAWCLAAALHRLRSALLEREADEPWVQQLPEARP